MEDVIEIESSPESPSRREENKNDEHEDDKDGGGSTAAVSPGTSSTGGENNDKRRQQHSENYSNDTTHNGVNGNTAAENQQPHVKGQPVILGGSISRAAFCVLQGFLLEQVSPPPATSASDNNKTTPTSPPLNHTGPKKPVMVPIDRLPAMLGRTHNTSDKNFFGLGKNVKALSRVQCCIEYRILTGKIGQYSNTSKFTYQPTTIKEKDKVPPAVPTASEIILNPTNAKQDDAGFYVITCKGKNPIRVNGLKVDQDQTCLLVHGSIIKISSFCLYFLLPTTLSTKTMEITIPIQASSSSAAIDNGGGGSSKKRRSSLETAADNGDGSSVVSTKKKRKTPEMLLSTATAATRAIPKVAASSSLSNGGGATAGVATTTVKRGGSAGDGGRGSAWKNVQDELDKKSTRELLQQLHEAVDNGTWDRKCQFVGSTISYRAVLEAAASPEIQQLAADSADGDDGACVGKSQIVEWINASPQFAAWAELMQSKLELKSYQSSIANGMRKAGFVRGGSINFGRNVKWLLPPEFRESGIAGGGGGDVSQSQPRGSDDDDDDDSDNNDESDGGNDDDEVHDDIDQDAAGSGGGRPDESDNVSGSESEG